MMTFRRLHLLSPLATTICNLLMVYVLYFVARIIYLMVNYSYFAQGLTLSHLMEMLGGGLVFDTTAILVTNIPYIVLMLLPWHGKETKGYQQLCRWVFVIINALAFAVNLCDAVYFRFTMRRTTTTIFSEFSHENNLGSIFLTETIGHIYLVAIFALLVWAIYKYYRQTGLRTSDYRWWHYDLVMLLSLAGLAPFVVAGIRGGFATAVRPITISNANQYVDHPVEAALVLNTPFSLYRTIGKAVFEVPDYYASEEEMAAVYTPIHKPLASDSCAFTKKNVVILIVESFGREYIGALNKTLEGGNYKGYTPHVDSLIAKSVSFSRSFCNGRKSIDGMPSILSSIPMFVEPFFLTPASMNNVSGIARLLAGEGYETAFFHGAQRGSMGFQAFARATGFQAYYGREDYDEDKRFGGDRDFDGMWAIWDEPFLQYYATKMSEMKEPFMTAVFTASSHHPYVVPEDDHTNLSDHAYYQTDLGGFCSPIIIYEPGNTERKPEIQNKIAQQIDILPTVMGMLHYKKPYFGFGIDLFNTPDEDTWAVNYLNGIYQYVHNGYVLQFDGQKTTGMYALTDSLMERNQVNKLENIQQPMERELKAIIQQYMERMTQDRLTSE